jgi:tetratricopeptide (TPR) repeat protein
MPEVSTVIATLKALAPVLAQMGRFAWNNLSQNSPAIRALKITSHQYSTRLPTIQQALETWIGSDQFRSQLEIIEQGGFIGTESSHVELFVTFTGLGLGVSSLETVRDALGHFYMELRGQILDGPHASRILSAQMADPSSRLPASTTVDPQAIPFRPQPEMGFASTALTELDRKAETNLDLVKGLIEKRKAGTALDLLSKLQDQVDRGELSAPLRFRFFVNKGVSLMMKGEWEQALLELGRAHTLEPKNPKALINLAQVLLHKGQAQDALTWLEIVIEDDSANQAANALRLACLHETGDVDRVRAILDAQPELADNQNCQYALAYIAYDQEHFSEAEHYLRRHNETKANSPEAWELLGRAIVVPVQRNLLETAPTPNLIPEDVKARLEEAAACFTQAEELVSNMEIHEELKYILSNRGITRMLLGLVDEARQDFEHALRLDPALDVVKRNLGNLHLAAGNPFDAVRIFREIAQKDLQRECAPLMAAALLDLQKPAEARSVIEQWHDSGSERHAFLFKEVYLIACQRLRDQDACQVVVRWLLSQATDPKASSILAEYYSREGDHIKAREFAEQAVEASVGEASRRYRLLLADILGRAGNFVEAADQYEKVLIPMDESKESRRRLFALFNAGRFDRALQVAQAVRNGRPAIPHFSEVEALILERVGDLDGANKLRYELLSADVTAHGQKLKIGRNHFRRGRRNEAAALALEVDLASIEEDAESLRDAATLRTLLELPGALVFAYRLLQLAPEDPDSHLFYINTFFRRDAIDSGLFKPEFVGPDCAVTLRQRGEKREWAIVLGKGDTARAWLSVDHDLAKQMLGKRAGEKFRFPKDTISEAEYEIEAIESKYVRAFQVCMSGFNERFPSNYGLQRMEVDSTDLTKIAVMLNEKREYGERILDLYRSGNMPACSIAQLFGQSDIEMFRTLTEYHAIKVLSFDGARNAMKSEETALSCAKHLIMEASALVTLHSLGFLEMVAGAFECMSITQFVLDELTSKAKDTFRGKKTGQIYSDRPGHIGLTEEDPEVINRERDFYEQLLHLAHTKCSIIAATDPDSLGHFTSAPVAKALGMEAWSTLAAAYETKCLLVSDDLPLRILAKNTKGIDSVGTLALMRDLRVRGALPAEEYHRAIHWLLEHGYGFVSIDKDDIIWAFREDQWSPKRKVAEVLQGLAGPDCDTPGAVRIGLDVLYAIWNEPLPTATQQLSSDLVIQAVLTGRSGGAVLRDLRVMNSQRSAIWTPAMESIQGVIEGWVRRMRN